MLTATTTAAAVPTIFIAAEEVFNAVTGEAAVIAYFFGRAALIIALISTAANAPPSKIRSISFFIFALALKSFCLAAFSLISKISDTFFSGMPS